MNNTCLLCIAYSLFPNRRVSPSGMSFKSSLNHDVFPVTFIKALIPHCHLTNVMFPYFMIRSPLASRISATQAYTPALTGIPANFPSSPPVLLQDSGFPVKDLFTPPVIKYAGKRSVPGKPLIKEIVILPVTIGSKCIRCKEGVVVQVFYENGQVVCGETAVFIKLSHHIGCGLQWKSHRFVAICTAQSCARRPVDQPVPSTSNCGYATRIRSTPASTVFSQTSTGTVMAAEQPLASVKV